MGLGSSIRGFTRNIKKHAVPAAMVGAGAYWSVPGLTLGGLSSFGQQAANAQNIDLMEENREWQADQAQINRDFSAKQVAKQMEFQERMSNTATQRQIKDLKAAGINPILAAGYGGASSPGGASASGTQPSSTAATVLDEVTPGVNSGMHMTRLKQELDNLSTDEWARRQQGALAHQQKVHTATSENKMQEEIRSVSAQAQIDELNAAAWAGLGKEMRQLVLLSQGLGPGVASGAALLKAFKNNPLVLKNNPELRKFTNQGLLKRPSHKQSPNTVRKYRQ